MNQRAQRIITAVLVWLGTVAASAQSKTIDQAAVETYRAAIRSAASMKVCFASRKISGDLTTGALIGAFAHAASRTA